MKIETKEIGSYDPKFVVCYSGGHSSAICAINAVLRHGKENVILLNHDISPIVEDKDIKRFKREVATYLDMDITYANHPEWETLTPIKNAVKMRMWKRGAGQILCTTKLKTEPFYKWIKTNDPECLHTYLYGFDDEEKEIVRMNRRIGVMAEMGYKTDYPIITWGKLEITDTEKQLGIKPPMTYGTYKHANCIGCLKAVWQHWYVVYVNNRELWEEAKQAEDIIKHSLKNDMYFEDKEPMFEEMLKAGIPATEHIPSGQFWSQAKAVANPSQYGFDFNKILQEEENACGTSCTG